MDNEMIERVAKAIRLRDTTDEYAMAREAIKAMREPTEKMMEAFDIASPMYDDPNTTGEEYWKAAIDAVINE